MGKLILITGGTRSGKSHFAQMQAEKCAGRLLYVATAGTHDDEMRERVRLHQTARGARWETLEEPYRWPEQLLPVVDKQGAVLVDCITLWLSNLFFRYEEDVDRVRHEVTRGLTLLKPLDVPVLLVTNEVGSGIVPDNRLARIFRDLAGEVNQQLGAMADEAWLVVAGLPLRLK
ncbi:MAG: bifunctional adenosylcobinamide kinase/adenosylcobinamide-phosphate guanylyltransferase [Desulfuromonadaceae bacterium]|nr:bifunctional adenosylcobinamide kinase/adenosylcobinamide-phosphate guanylyltransferase [Desulfuromonadaceae bacterium]